MWTARFVVLFVWGSLIKSTSFSGVAFKNLRIIIFQSVHFLCGHSFHKHCFSTYMENDRECPICYQENQKILSKIRQPDKLLTQAWLSSTLRVAPPANFDFKIDGS